jgi:phosphoglycerol transferase MdoB-like AlkP superfamily enzyme
MFDGYVLTVAKSLFSGPTTDYESLAAVSIDELRARYDALIYPRRNNSPPDNLVDLDPSVLVPRHIVIVSLETAPMRFYRLFDDPSLANFYRLSQKAIVSEHHYSNTPFTTGAAASISSGLYTLRKEPDRRFPPYTLPRVLGERNYRSSYVDSFLIDWRSNTTHRRTYEILGFQSLVDSTEFAEFDPGNTTFEYESSLEKEAVNRVASAVREAEAAGEKAIVFLQTGLGHFPWNAPESRADDSDEDKLYGLVREYDKNIGLLIKHLDEAALTDKTIVVITGDHGLRYNGEFQSLGLQIAHSDAAFNVPLIIAAPGLLDQQVRVPFVTSHVDLAPTLLSMVGISLDSMFHHGADILKGAPADRVTRSGIGSGPFRS